MSHDQVMYVGMGGNQANLSLPLRNVQPQKTGCQLWKALEEEMCSHPSIRNVLPPMYTQPCAHSSVDVQDKNACAFYDLSIAHSADSVGKEILELNYIIFYGCLHKSLELYQL